MDENRVELLKSKNVLLFSTLRYKGFHLTNDFINEIMEQVIYSESFSSEEHIVLFEDYLKYRDYVFKKEG